MSSINEALRRTQRLGNAAGRVPPTVSGTWDGRPRRFPVVWAWVIAAVAVLSAAGILGWRITSGLAEKPEPRAPVRPPVAASAIETARGGPAPENVPETTREAAPTPPVKSAAPEPAPASGLSAGLDTLSAAEVGGARDLGLGPLAPAPAEGPQAGLAGDDSPAADVPSGAEALGAGPAAVSVENEPETPVPADEPPVTAEDHFQRAETAAAEGRTAEAEAEYLKAVEKDPKMTAARLNLGNLYLFQDGDSARAREMYEAVLAQDPKNKIALNNLGVVFLRAGKLKPAEARFSQAMELDPEYVDPLYNLACVAARSDRASLALSYLLRAKGRNAEVAQWAATDEDLKGLRNLPAFQTLVQGAGR